MTTITLEQTIAEMNDVVLNTLPMTTLTEICNKHNVLVEDVRMGTFVVHNLIDNGLLDMMVESSKQPIVDVMLTANNINITSKMLEEVRMEIFEAEIEHSINH